jgi:hypothetical protein
MVAPRHDISCATLRIALARAAAHALHTLAYLFVWPLVPCSGVGVISNSTFEAGCGKTALNGSFGVVSHLIDAYVDAEHDVLGALDVVAAVAAPPSLHCIAIESLQGPSAAGTHSISNSSDIHHIEHAQDGSMKLFRHQGIRPGRVLTSAESNRCR